MLGKLTAKKIAYIAMFSALAYAISFLEFPIFPGASFLKIDFSNVFILIGGFSLGPIASVIILLVKESLRLITSSTGGIGEIANFIIGFSFVAFPTVLYRFKKGFKVVIITLIIATLLQVLTALPVNKFINFPLYGVPGEAFKGSVWYIVAFNLIKGVLISIITILLYKRVKKILKI